MKLTILMLLIAFGIFMLGLKVTGDSPVSRKAPIEKSKETTEEKWLKAKEWSKNRNKWNFYPCKVSTNHTIGTKNKTINPK